MRLVPFSAEHLDAMAEVIFDDDVRRFTGFPEPPDLAWLPTLLERYERGREEGARAGFAVLDAGGAFAGLALAVSIDAEGRQCELGYLVAPAFRGRGVATWSLGELTRWAFDEQRLLRCELLIEAGNAGSRLVAERCGYVCEGVRRSVHLKGGRRGDQAIYARLAA